MNSSKSVTVYIYNAIEDEWPFLQATTDKKTQKIEINDCYLGAECFLYFNTDDNDLIYITGKQISENYLQYYQSVMGEKNISVYVPKQKSGQICLDLIKDATTFNQLLAMLKKYNSVVLKSYSASNQFYELLDKLLEQKLNITTPESPTKEEAWTVNFFGSKVGFRQLSQKIIDGKPLFHMPEGYICPSKSDAIQTAAHMFIQHKGVVIKTSKGNEGNGVLIFFQNDLPYSFGACVKKLTTILDKNDYWEKFPIVVEQLIDVDKNIGGGFPSTEGKVNADGRPEALYTCAMRVTEKGAFFGIEIGDGLLGESLDRQITQITHKIAEEYSKAGYRGHFDIDFLVDKMGKLYANESNTRNNGSSDVAKLATKFFSPTFYQETFIASSFRNISFEGKQTNLTFTEVLKICKPILFDKVSKQGIIFNGELILKDNQLFYTIFSPNKKTTYQLENTMTKLFKENSITLTDPQ